MEHPPRRPQIDTDVLEHGPLPAAGYTFGGRRASDMSTSTVHADQPAASTSVLPASESANGDGNGESSRDGSPGSKSNKTTTPTQTTPKQSSPVSGEMQLPQSQSSFNGPTDERTTQPERRETASRPPPTRLIMPHPFAPSSSSYEPPSASSSYSATGTHFPFYSPTSYPPSSTALSSRYGSIDSGRWSFTDAESVSSVPASAGGDSCMEGVFERDVEHGALRLRSSVALSLRSAPLIAPLLPAYASSFSGSTEALAPPPPQAGAMLPPPPPPQSTEAWYAAAAHYQLEQRRQSCPALLEPPVNESQHAPPAPAWSVPTDSASYNPAAASGMSFASPGHHYSSHPSSYTGIHAPHTLMRVPSAPVLSQTYAGSSHYNPASAYASSADSLSHHPPAASYQPVFANPPGWERVQPPTIHIPTEHVPSPVVPPPAQYEKDASPGVTYPEARIPLGVSPPTSTPSGGGTPFNTTTPSTYANMGTPFDHPTAVSHIILWRFSLSFAYSLCGLFHRLITPAYLRYTPTATPLAQSRRRTNLHTSPSLSPQPTSCSRSQGDPKRPSPELLARCNPVSTKCTSSPVPPPRRCVVLASRIAPHSLPCFLYTPLICSVHYSASACFTR